jgi:hypothetical protein
MKAWLRHPDGGPLVLHPRQLDFVRVQHQARYTAFLGGQGAGKRTTGGSSPSPGGR